MTRRFEDPRAAFASAGVMVFEGGWLPSNGVLFPASASSGATLVDSGYVAHAAQTQALLRNALRGQALRRILNIQLHSDHCWGQCGASG